MDHLCLLNDDNQWIDFFYEWINEKLDIKMIPISARQHLYKCFDRDDIDDLDLIKAILITKAGWSAYMKEKIRDFNKHNYQYH